MNKSTLKQGSTILNAIIMSITTIITCLLSYLVWKSEQQSNYINEQATESSNRINTINIELERYRQSILLCDKINELYNSFNTPEIDDMIEFKLWEMGEEFDYTIFSGINVFHVKKIAKQWQKMDKHERLEKLTKNTALKNLFYYFEDAMMLYHKDLLDNRYFDNYLSNIISRLESTQNPSVEEYIDTMCYHANRNDIWEGYRFCRDSILLEQVIIPRQSNSSLPSTYISELNVTIGSWVQAGDCVAILKSHDYKIKDKEYHLSIKRNGYVDKILVSTGEKVRDGQIIMEIRPK